MLRKNLLGLMALGVFSFCGAMDNEQSIQNALPREVCLLNNQFVFSLVDDVNALPADKLSRVYICDCSCCDCNYNWIRNCKKDAHCLRYKLNVPNCIFGNNDSVFILINITHKDSCLEFSGVSCFRYLDEYDLTLGALTISLFESQISEFIPYYLGRMLLQALLLFELVDFRNFQHEFNKKIYTDFSSENMLCCNVVILPCLHCFDADKISSLSKCPICFEPFAMKSALVYCNKQKTPFPQGIRNLILSEELHRPASWRLF